MQWWIWVIMVIGGYLLGSIPTGYLLVKLKKGIDVRKVGSGNVGTTNTVRAAGAATGAIVFVADIIKGLLPALIGGIFSPELAIVAGFAAFLGHLWPIWLGFSGGKGVATILGVVLVINPWLALICLGTWVITLLVTGYVSIASCFAALLVLVLSFIMLDNTFVSIVLLLMVALVWLRHLSNFRNILAGKEDRKFRRKK